MPMNLRGVANDRSIVGIANEHIFAEMDGIVNSISDACEPKVPVDICVENVEGKSLIALDVFAGTRCPYYLKSQGDKDGVYIRVGATSQQADDATRHELALESAGRSFDKEPCLDAKISDKSIKALCAKMYKTARWNCKTDAERRGHSGGGRVPSRRRDSRPQGGLSSDAPRSVSRIPSDESAKRGVGAFGLTMPDRSRTCASKLAEESFRRISTERQARTAKQPLGSCDWSVQESCPK